MKNYSQSPSESFFSQFKVLPNTKICVVIPVRDEEFYIKNSLQAFAEQVDMDGNLFDSSQFEILILANNCSDNSVTFIREFQQNYPGLNLFLEEVTLTPDKSNIGYVRRILMEAAFSRLSENGGGIILTTDGDTIVAPDWISKTLLEFQKGVEVVCGRILLADDELRSLDEVTRFHHLKDEKYHLLIAELEGVIMNDPADPNPRHHQHFNGSFAITTDCYERSGGVPFVKNLEDCAFFERLEGIDAKIRHSYEVTVHTSARCIGRTEIGLSQQLNVWKNLKGKSQDYIVESASSIFKRLVLKKRLRNLWDLQIDNSFDLRQALNEAIPGINIGEDDCKFLMNNRYFGKWYHQILNLKSKDIKSTNPEASSIETAIQDLQNAVENRSVRI